MQKVNLHLTTINYFFILIAAIGMELYIPFVLLNGPGKELFPIALAAHTCICLATALIFFQNLPERYQTNFTIACSFLFLIGFFIPALGIIGLSLALIPGLQHIKADKKVFKVAINEIPPLPSTAPTISTSQLGRLATPAKNLLASDDPNKRLEALIATLKLRDKDAVPLLRQALRDPEDDIRLLAYALIDRKEQTISDRIQSQLEAAKAHHPSNSLHFYKRIASDYWELVHSGLVQGEMLSFTLQQAFQQVHAGLDHHPNDAGLRFQLARLLLKAGKFEEANAEFERAAQLGFDRKQLLPYFAEIEFSSKRFDKVKQHMDGINFPVSHSDLCASVRYWRKGINS